MYNDAQKALLSLVVIPCCLLCYLMFRFGKRSLRGSQRFSQRMDYLYSFTAASLMGEFLFQAFPNSSLPSLAANVTQIEPGHPPLYSSIPSIFIMIGLFVMLCYQKYARVWNDSPNYVAPDQSTNDLFYIIDADRMEALDVFEAEGVNNSNVGQDRFAIQDENAELMKRRRLALITLFVMNLLCILEGFFLIYQTGSRWIIYGAFVVDKLMETLVVCVVMLHAFYHVNDPASYHRFGVGAGVWCCVVVCSTIPALMDMSTPQATYVVTHLATSIFYAFSGGVLFWLAIYYIQIDLKRTDLKETFIRSFLFAVTASVSWVVGHFY